MFRRCLLSEYIYVYILFHAWPLLCVPNCIYIYIYKSIYQFLLLHICSSALRLLYSVSLSLPLCICVCICRYCRWHSHYFLLDTCVLDKSLLRYLSDKATFRLHIMYLNVIRMLTPLCPRLRWGWGRLAAAQQQRNRYLLLQAKKGFVVMPGLEGSLFFLRR